MAVSISASAVLRNKFLGNHLILPSEWRLPAVTQATAWTVAWHLAMLSGLNLSDGLLCCEVSTVRALSSLARVSMLSDGRNLLVVWRTSVCSSATIDFASRVLLGLWRFGFGRSPESPASRVGELPG